MDDRGVIMDRKGTKHHILILVLLVLFLFPVSSIGASTQWSKTYSSDKMFDYPTCIRNTSDGGYVLILISWPVGVGSEAGVLKLNSDGSSAWLKTISGLDGSYIDSIWQTSDGGYILAGSTFPLTGSAKACLVKLDSDGSLTWKKTYGEKYEFNSIMQTSDGGYIVAGYIPPVGEETRDLWVVKLNPDGSIAWQKTYGPAYEEFEIVVQQTSDGGYILGGKTRSFGAGEGDAWLLKLNPDGSIAWQKTYGSSYDDSLKSVQQTSDGGYIVAGFTCEERDCDTNLSWVLKLDSGGNVAWKKTLSSDSETISFDVARQTSDGGYIVSGERFADYVVTWFKSPRLLKLNSIGQKVWETTYVHPCDSRPRSSAEETTDGGYIVAGDQGCSGPFFVLKLDSTGNIPDCPNLEFSDTTVTETTFSVSSTSVVGVNTNITPVTDNATITENSVTVSTGCTEAVSKPSIPDGTAVGTTGVSYAYTAGESTSDLGHPVEYQFDWKGDGTVLSEWGSQTQSNTWDNPGIYNVRARARCTIHTNVTSEWSDPFTVTINLPSVSCTITANLTGLEIIVDHSTYTAPQAFDWIIGSEHTIGVPSPQDGDPGVHYIFTSWSDGGARTHTISTPDTSTVYTASFGVQHSLTTSINPSESGSVDPSGTNWYDINQSIPVSATPSSGYTFVGWSGDLSGVTNPTFITMDAPKSVTASFESIAVPDSLIGPTSGITETAYDFTAGGSSSNLGHQLEYQFDWKGDGTDLSDWGSATQTKSWTVAGNYDIRARARCATHTDAISSWSSPLSISLTATITIDTNPSGLEITVDGLNYASPRSFNWSPGTEHSVSVSSPQEGGTGTRYVFLSWSDEGEQAHTIVAPDSYTSYTASFTTQYSLVTAVSPSEAGSVSPSGTNWYDSGELVSVSATANSAYGYFGGWSGDLSGTDNPLSVTMDGPKNGVADFIFTKITLLKPNMTEVVPSGSNYVICWGATTGASKFKLSYSMNNGTTWKPITTDFVTGTNLEWSVPKPTANKKSCLVKVTGYNDSNVKVGTDKSDNSFMIEVVKLDSPNGGEPLTAGSTGSTISWTTNGTKRDVAKVILYLTMNGGATWSRVVPLTENTGSYDTWTVPGVLKTKTQCKVRVVLKDADGLTLGSDVSDGFFTIQNVPLP
jgi:uncharacterized repeat protein (TIGR02543 family)